MLFVGILYLLVLVNIFGQAGFGIPTTLPSSFGSLEAYYFGRLCNNSKLLNKYLPNSDFVHAQLCVHHFRDRYGHSLFSEFTL